MLMMAVRAQGIVSPRDPALGAAACGGGLASTLRHLQHCTAPPSRQ